MVEVDSWIKWLECMVRMDGSEWMAGGDGWSGWLEWTAEVGGWSEWLEWMAVEIHLESGCLW
jgi:hypothetical protein